MDGADIFRTCILRATAVVKQVRLDHFANATPDTDWNVRDLLAHMTRELVAVPQTLAGSLPADIGAATDEELLGSNDIDLSINWQAAVDRAERALDDIDSDEIIHTAQGDMSIDDYLSQIASDELIHAWDLGASIGVPVHFDSSLAGTVYDIASPSRQLTHDSERFAHEIEIVGEADMHTKLLALFGRRADWRAS